MKRSFLSSILSVALVGLGLVPTGVSSAQAGAPKIKVATTTTMVTDLVQSVGGDRVAVQGLMGPGVDPHLYKATASDVAKLQQADVIFYSGLHLEGKMQELFDKMQSRKKVHAIADAVPKEKLLKPAAFAGQFDPHIWFEVPLWQMGIEVVVQGLATIDPGSKSDYEKRGAALKIKMQKLHEDALQKVAELPREKRILVTSHDAYNYFGRAYGFQVVGLQGVSTTTEAGLADMAKMVDFIKKNQVKAIFVESSVPHNAIERISKDSGVKIGGELFSDAMGTPGQMENGADLGTYEGMVKHNIHTIVDALK